MTHEAAGPVKFAILAQNQAGTKAIVSAVTNRKIRIIGCVIVATTAVSVTWEDEDGTDLMGPMALGANGILVLPQADGGWQETASGKGLNLLAPSVQVSGCLMYQEVK